MLTSRFAFEKGGGNNLIKEILLSLREGQKLPAKTLRVKREGLQE